MPDRKRKKFHINGARGVALLGLGATALIFGVAFAGPWFNVYPPPPGGLVLLDRIIPLNVWGWVWYLAGVILVLGAFREDQSRSMRVFAGMLFVWGASYVWAAIDTGRPVYALSAAVYFSILVACLGVARLVNSPPVDIEKLRRRVRPWPNPSDGGNGGG